MSSSLDPSPANRDIASQHMGNSQPIGASNTDGSNRPLSFDSDKTAIRQGDLLDIRDVQVNSGSAPSRNQSLGIANYLIGQQLDHFRIESLVGTGGMGAVFRGHDLRLDRTVAIKVVPIIDRDAEAMRRFRFEAQSAAKLDHPNIARVYYVGETEEWSYIVFEFVEGTNLRELVMNRGVLGIDDAVFLTRQVAEALQHAWERKVVHRDIKPSNILVTLTGQAKLVDMGLARTTELDRSTNDLTASGVTLGTFDYISPEQAHDPRAADVRSDIYSLGCTLYFLLTGSPPFREGTALQKLLLHGTKYPEDPRYLRSDISDSLIAILRKMMAKKPEDRYNSPDDLIQDLTQLANLEGLDRSKKANEESMIPSISRRSSGLALLPFLISLVAIAGTTLWMHIASYQSAAFPIPKEEIPEQEFGKQESEPSTNPILVTEPPKPLDTLTVGPIENNDPNTDFNRVETIGEAIESAERKSEIRQIKITGDLPTTAVKEMRSSLKIRSKLSLQGDSTSRNGRSQWIIEGGDTSTDSASSRTLIECMGTELILENLDIIWRTSNTAKHRALISLQPGSILQVKNCSITIHDESRTTNLPTLDGATSSDLLFHILSVEMEKDGVLGIASEERQKLVTRISYSNGFARGQCHFLRVQNSQRVEMNLENAWFALGGSVVSSVGNKNSSRTGVSLRMDLRKVTSYSLRPWLQFDLTNNLPFPKPIVRNAIDCVFAGGLSHIEWDASNCQDWKGWEQSEDGRKLINWIDLRGVDNTYDSSTLTNLLAVKMKLGKVELVPLELDSKLFGDERGIETQPAWRKKPKLDFSKIHETKLEQLEWQSGTYQPGFSR